MAVDTQPTKTICILIGNSDNKLSQNEWAHFVVYAKQAIESFVCHIHFNGGPETSAPWQNWCWVCECVPENVTMVEVALRRVRAAYKQDSIAVLVGDTQFI